jgi:NAD-dependent deacetylase
MATRQMYEAKPGQFLLWYYSRFASYRNVPPNDVHRWLADECNAGHARLITQNIDGLDGRAGNRDYVCIHGRLDLMTRYDDQMALHDAMPPSRDVTGTGDEGGMHDVFSAAPFIPAPWDGVVPDTGSDAALEAELLAQCQIDAAAGPQPGVSLKPYVLLFDEYYTDLYRMGTAESWMAEASRMVFVGTSFSVNITAIALRSAISRGIPVEIVDPAPVDLGIPEGMADITCHRMTAKEWAGV